MPGLIASAMMVACDSDFVWAGGCDSNPPSLGNWNSLCRYGVSRVVVLVATKSLLGVCKWMTRSLEFDEDEDLR